MEVVRRGAELRAGLDRARARGAAVGLVPTMGALHAGHEALLTAARQADDVVAATIFVNPLQFGEAADLDRYPRTEAEDLERCAAAGVDVVFCPPLGEMYPTWPEPPATTVTVAGPARPYEGAGRPGHFDGVATVVAKLFALAGPCRAYFGEKDFQQLAVVRTMVRDLCLPVEIVPRPTVREDDGLALSSRNRRLDGPDRAAATVLWRALQAGRAAVAAGTADPGAVERVMAEVIGAEPRAALEYTACVDPADFTPAPLGPGSHARLLVAARVGPVRLIDNCAAAVPAGIPAGAGGRATAGET